MQQLLWVKCAHHLTTDVVIKDFPQQLKLVKVVINFLPTMQPKLLILLFHAPWTIETTYSHNGLSFIGFMSMLHTCFF